MDAKWELMKMMGAEVSVVLGTLGESQRAERMSECARRLTTQQCECGCELVWRTNYCRDRLCPVCEWRKSIVLARRASAAIARAKHDAHDVVMMTLTVRNVPWRELRATVQKMHREWQALWRMLSGRWEMYGYIRRTEITVGRDGCAHPHMHILVDRHSEGGYVRQKALCTAWKNAMGLSYDPIVDIRVCWEQREKGLTRYIHKYCTKSSTAILLALSEEDARSYIEAVKGLRMVSSGGTLRMKDPTEATEDELMAGIDEVVLQRKWCDHSGDFVCKCPRCGKLMRLERAVWSDEAKAYVVEWDGPLQQKGSIHWGECIPPNPLLE